MKWLDDVTEAAHAELDRQCDGARDRDNVNDEQWSEQPHE